MTDVPPGGLPPPPSGPSGYPPPPSAPGGYPPPSPGYPYPGYQQAGYGFSAGYEQPQFAGFWIRFLASFIDSLILGIPVALVSFIIDPDQFYVSAGAGYNPGVPPIVNLISTVVGVLYYTLLEGGSTGQTLGKKICGIKVVDATTFQTGVGNGRGLIRYLGRILSSIPCLLGYFWMLWDPKKQTWHDKLARTCVVKAS